MIFLGKRANALCHVKVTNIYITNTEVTFPLTNTWRTLDQIKSKIHWYSELLHCRRSLSCNRITCMILLYLWMTAAMPYKKPSRDSISKWTKFTMSGTIINSGLFTSRSCWSTSTSETFDRGIFRTVNYHRGLTQSLKVGLSLSKKVVFIYFNESPLKMMKNAFYLMLKAIFVLDIFKFLFWYFGYVEEWLDKKVKVNLKNYDVIDWIINNYKISRSTANQTIKFGQLIEFNLKYIFLEKSYTNVVKLVPDHFIKL